MTEATDNTGRIKLHRLLAAIGTRTPDDSRNIDAPVYDWHLPHYFNTLQMKKVGEFASKVASLIAEKFATLFQKSFEVTITSTSEHFASQFLGQEPAAKTQGPNNYYLHFGVGAEEPCGFVSIPPQTAAFWTTQLLGDTESKEAGEKSLSELESSLLFDISSLIIECLSQAGQNCVFRPAANAMLDHLPFAPKGAEEFAKITFAVKKTGSDFAIVTPDRSEASSEAHILVFCEKLAEAISESSQRNPDRIGAKDITNAIQGHVETIPVAVTCQLACVPVTVEQLLNLSAGDVLLLDKKIDEPAVLLAAGRTVARGRCAKSAGNYALFVTETLF